MPTDLSDEILERALTGRFGRPRRVLHSVDSTNLEAFRWVASHGVGEGALVVADHQSAGRGRWGRSWFDEPGRSLMFSLVLNPAPDATGLITTAVGVGVAEGIAAATGLEVLIKWPNDLVVSGRKVAGILVESRSSGADMVVVAGVGINVQAPSAAMPADIAHRATSLAAELDAVQGRVPERGRLLAAALGAIEEALVSLGSAEGRRDVVARAEARSAVLGRDIVVRLADGGRLRGRALRLAPDGQLVIDGADGERTVAAGEIESLRPAPTD